jgi:hypothetical protein
MIIRNWNVAENVVLPTYIVLLKHRRCKQREILGMLANLRNALGKTLTCSSSGDDLRYPCSLGIGLPAIERALLDGLSTTAVNPNDSMTVKLASRVIIGFQVCSRRRVSTYAPWTNRMVGSLGSWPVAHPSPTARFYDLKEEGTGVRGTNLWPMCLRMLLSLVYQRR